MIEETIGNATLYCGDSNEILDIVDAVDSCVTDPPYGLSFMGKQWDYDVPTQELWEKVYQSIKQGGHLLSFFGSRTYHRGVIPIEDAGFDIRDQLMWLYGSGFPKSHNIGKSLDKSAGVKRKVVGKIEGMGYTKSNVDHGAQTRTHTTFDKFSDDAVTPEAKEWSGWGTALKPAHEPIVMARKPFKGTVANNVLEHGTGGINIDGCRVGDEQGRFPANVMHDGSEEVLEIFPQTGKSSGGSGISSQKSATGEIYGEYKQGHKSQNLGGLGDEGTASRYFYCAKASKQDREDGNNHPTVKPTKLMQYLCRLVTPKGGVVLDPFMGSGSTGKGALLEGFGFIGIEMEREYFDIACARLEAVQKNVQVGLFE
jgi:site-specific DNA-methyltransferase (adenine-specific)